MKHVLFLDDEEYRREAFHLALRDHADRVTVRYAVTADEAVAAMLAQRFDVACLDHDLAAEHYYETEQVEIPQRPHDGTWLTQWLADVAPAVRPGAVVVHSMNGAGAKRMCATLADAGVWHRWWMFGPQLPDQVLALLRVYDQ